jgi:hypothetical protein
MASSILPFVNNRFQEPTGPCNVCGETTEKECSQCHLVFYCGRDHQKRDWKRHKPICCLAAEGSSVKMCTRCQEEDTDGEESRRNNNDACQIPHPEHLQTATGSSFGGASGQQHQFYCRACHQGYEKSSPQTREIIPISELPITGGAKWCYQGPHTTNNNPLKKSDQRRVCKDVVVLHSGPDMQAKINALDGNESVRVLTLSSDGCSDDDDDNNKPQLAIRLPNLLELQTVNVDLGRLKLTPNLTPKLQKISMQNPTQDDDPNFTIDCPELRDFSCDYFGPGEYGWLSHMLKRATKLERFDSYKLRVGHLRFASNHLKYIRLHRAELLERIDVWAPRLTQLDVQAAYDLDEIYFLKNHPLERDLPANFVCREELTVNAINACLGRQAMAELNAHPRVHGEIEMEDDDYF